MTRFSQAHLDDIKARNPLGDVAGGYVKLRRVGSDLVGPCPVCGGRAASQRFAIKDNGESWVCAVCADGGDVISFVQKVEGCDFLGAIERLGGGQATPDRASAKKLFEERERKRIEREKVAAGFREAERKRLYRMWNSALPVHDTPAARYLADRGCQIPDLCPGLRFAAEMPYFHGETLDGRTGKAVPRVVHRGPAMVGAFIRPNGTFGGLHLTWLASAEDGTIAKAEISDPDTGEVLNSKKMRGSKTGAHILVAKAKAIAPRRLFVGEGIETVDSVFTALMETRRCAADDEFWAAGDLGNLAGRAVKTVAHPTLTRPNGRAMSVPNDMPDPDDPGLSIPDSIEELILLGDGDSEPVLTRFAMMRAARRYGRPGRMIRIAFAPDGLDFNNVLRASQSDVAIPTGDHSPAGAGVAA